MTESKRIRSNARGPKGRLTPKPGGRYKTRWIKRQKAFEEANMTNEGKALLTRIREVAEDLHKLRHGASVMGTSELLARLSSIDAQVQAVLAPAAPVAPPVGAQVI